MRREKNLNQLQKDFKNINQLYTHEKSKNNLLETQIRETKPINTSNLYIPPSSNTGSANSSPE